RATNWIELGLYQISFVDLFAADQFDQYAQNLLQLLCPPVEQSHFVDTDRRNGGFALCLDDILQRFISHHGMRRSLTCGFKKTCHKIEMKLSRVCTQGFNSTSQTMRYAYVMSPRASHT